MAPPSFENSKKWHSPYSTGPFPQNFPKSNRFGSKMLSNDEISIVYMIFSYRVAQSPKIFQLRDKKGSFLKNAPPILRVNWKNGPLLSGGKKKTFLYDDLFWEILKSL